MLSAFDGELADAVVVYHHGNAVKRLAKLSEDEATFTKECDGGAKWDEYLEACIY